MSLAQGSFNMNDRVGAIAASLQDLEKPTTCPVCMVMIGGYIQMCFLEGDDSLVEVLRTKQHVFWDACVAMLTVPRDPDAVLALRTHLAETARNCWNQKEHRTVERNNPWGSNDPLFVFVEGLCYCLRACLEGGDHSLVERLKPDKVFKSKRSQWPDGRKSLFPFREKMCVESLVYWCSLRFSDEPMKLLRILIMISRPTMLPHLHVEPVHGAIVYIMAQMFHNDLRAVPDGWIGPSPFPPSALMANPLPRWNITRKAVKTAAHFLTVLDNGPDMQFNDNVPFNEGYEIVLFCAVQKAARFISTDHEHFTALAAKVTELYKANGHDDLLNVDPNIVKFLRESFRTKKPTLVNSTVTYLRRLAQARRCTGPGCGCAVHESGENKPFPRCAQCKMTRYCSRECQKADWKQAKPHPHRVICPLVCRLMATINIWDEFPLLRDAFVRAGFTNVERNTLAAWAMCAMSPEMAEHLTDIFRRMNSDRVDLADLPPREQEEVLEFAMCMRDGIPCR